MNNERIQEIIFDALDEINEQLIDRDPLKKTQDTILYGGQGALDSVGLINLIVATEQRLEEELEVSVILADEKAMSLANSPFRTVKTFTEYIQTLIEENGSEESG